MVKEIPPAKVGVWAWWGARRKQQLRDAGWFASSGGEIAEGSLSLAMNSWKGEQE